MAKLLSKLKSATSREKTTAAPTPAAKPATGGAAKSTAAFLATYDKSTALKAEALKELQRKSEALIEDAANHDPEALQSELVAIENEASLLKKQISDLHRLREQIEKTAAREAAAAVEAATRAQRKRLRDGVAKSVPTTAVAVEAAFDQLETAVREFVKEGDSLALLAQEILIEQYNGDVVRMGDRALYVTPRVNGTGDVAIAIGTRIHRIVEIVNSKHLSEIIPPNQFSRYLPESIVQARQRDAAQVAEWFRDAPEVRK